MSKSVWRSIEIDDDVFAFIQRKSKPLVESANDVLRRLLLKDLSSNKKRRSSKAKLQPVSDGPLVTSKMFVDSLLRHRFGSNFSLIGGFSYFFEGPNELVYFQNYNKSDAVLWYRIDKRPRSLLNANTTSWLVFTNPSERTAYILPMSKVEAAADNAGWSRDYFEVHIDTRNNHWTELGWDLTKYRRKINP